MTNRFLINPLDQPVADDAVDWWPVSGQTCVGAWQAKGAASLADSYTDLSGNGNDLTLGTAPTWDSTNGWTFNGTTQYLKTGIIPLMDQSYSMFVRFSNGTANNKSLAQVIDTALGRRFGFSPSYFGTGIAGWYVDRQVTDAGVMTSGVLGMAGRGIYRDGVHEGNVTAISVAAIALDLYLAARNTNGSAQEHWPGYIQAAATYSTTLSAGDVAALTTSMNAL